MGCVGTDGTDAFGASASQVGRSQQPFGYTGQQVDTDGLVYLRARSYDPNSGRFMTRDPMAGYPADPLNLNRYTYVENSPVLTPDPSGLSPSGPPDYSGAELGDLIGPSKSRALADNQCATSDDGTFQGYLISATCLAFPLIGQGQVAVQTPAGVFSLPVTFSAAPTGPGGGNGRAGKQTRLRTLATDPKASSADRGWILQELNQIARGLRTTIRVPFGKVLAHRRGYEAKKGYSYQYSDLQDIIIHKIQHEFEGY